jgi:iron complex outermembrane receptor protein
MQGEAGVRRVIGGRLHTLTITAENLGDRVWRDHLSRIKAVAPQPGRNIRVLYRVAF